MTMQEDILSLVDFLLETDGEDETTEVAGYVIEDGVRYHVKLKWDLSGDEAGVGVTVNGQYLGVATDSGEIIESMDYYTATYGEYATF